MNNSVDAKTLKKWLEEGRKIRVIDIRNPDQYDAAHIPGSENQGVSVAVKQGKPDAVDALVTEDEIPIITVCNQGGSCSLAAQLLRDKGIEAYSLEGGMKGWLEESNDGSVK